MQLAKCDIMVGFQISSHNYVASYMHNYGSYKKWCMN